MNTELYVGWLDGGMTPETIKNAEVLAYAFVTVFPSSRGS